MFACSGVFATTVPSGFVISCVPSFTFGMLFFTFFNAVGAFSPFVPLGPFTDVTTSPF